MHDNNKRTFSEWVRSSLKAHILVFQLLGSAPFFVFFLGFTYFAGVLTLAGVFYILIASTLFGLVSAILVWYLITLRVMRKYGARD
jgi:hypothetical protein